MNINCTRSSAIAERSAQSAMSVEVLAYCCTNNANRSRVSSRSTFNNCHVLFPYLHSFVHASFDYRSASMLYAVGVINKPPDHQSCTCWCQLDHTCDHQIRLQPELLTTQRIPPPALRYGRGRPWRMDINFRRWPWGAWAETS